jgi:tRNA pseudouridine38-40 synthase
MPNFKIILEYDGTNYAGWQAQKSKLPTIQETIEKALRKILREKINLIASGRTDAGVHALAQVANFKSDSKVPLEKLQRSLNGLLPADISVTKIEDADNGFHSRFSAKSKTYRYAILNRPCRSAFLREGAYFYPYPLDLKLMQKEARALLGKQDFKSFCASASSVKDTVRTIKKIVIKRDVQSSVFRVQCSEFSVRGPQRGLIIIDIEADGFLYNMVRNIVGTLIEIGRGKFPAGSMIRILRSKNRKFAGPTAPARGLVLLKVKY